MVSADPANECKLTSLCRRTQYSQFVMDGINWGWKPPDPAQEADLPNQPPGTSVVWEVMLIRFSCRSRKTVSKMIVGAMKQRLVKYRDSVNPSQRNARRGMPFQLPVSMPVDSIFCSCGSVVLEKIFFLVHFVFGFAHTLSLFDHQISRSGVYWVHKNITVIS